MRARAAGRLKALAEAATKDAGVGGTADLQQQTPNFAAVPCLCSACGIREDSYASGVLAPRKEIRTAAR